MDNPDNTKKHNEMQKPCDPSKSAYVVPAGDHTAEAVSQYAAEGAKPQMSRGEKVYNYLVYSGLNYWVNLISSVIIADYFSNGAGRNKLDWTVGKIAKSIEKMGVSLEKAHHNSRVAMETLALMSGGYALLVPLKILEDNKRKAVHWLNNRLGENQCAPDGRELTSEEIHIADEQPKQSWWNVIKRRVLGTVLVVGTGSIIDATLADKSVRMPDHEYKINPYDPSSETVRRSGHLGGKDWVTGKVMGVLNKGIEHLPGGQSMVKEGHIVQRYLSLAALDTVFTKITAMTMWFTRGSENKKMPDEIDTREDMQRRHGVDQQAGSAGQSEHKEESSHAGKGSHVSALKKEPAASHKDALAMSRAAEANATPTLSA